MKPSLAKQATSRAWALGRVICIAGCGLLLGWHLARRWDFGTQGLSCLFADQKAAVEAAYWENVNFDNAALAKLTPEQLASGIIIYDSDMNRRKQLWDFYLPHYTCPQKEKVGTLEGDGDNGKWLCGVRTLLQRPGCVVYSVGSNGDVSFEQGILQRTKCEVHVFDPTLTEAMRAQVEAVKGAVFHDYGLGNKDGWVNLGTDTTQTKGRIVQKFETKTLPTIMQELGHKWVDVLKIDIEGAEWDVLDHLLNQTGVLPFTQLQVEYHNMARDALQWSVGSMKTVGGVFGSQTMAQMKRVMAGMLTKDFRAFSSEPNVWWNNNGFDYIEYSYIQVDKDGNIVSPALGPQKPRSLRGRHAT